MVSRRRILQGGLLSAAGITSGCATSTTTATSGSTVSSKTFVLVHGAWHGGWCWDQLTKILRADGHTVYAPSLSGLGDRVHLNEFMQVGLKTHIDDIVNLIRFEELKDIVLVGHSYAGMVISGVADQVNSSVAELVFLDALVPSNGGSLFDPYAEFTDELVEKIAASIPGSDSGFLDVPSLEFLGVPVDHPMASSLLQRLRPHPLKTLQDRLDYKNAGTGGVTKSFIYCTAQMMSDDTQRKLGKIKINNDWGYYEIDTGHNAMTTEPLQLANLLYQIIS